MRTPHDLAGRLGEPSDGDLLKSARDGDERAASLLYQRYAGRLRALARGRVSPGLARLFDPDDVVQSVFRRLFSNARSGDYSVPEGRELWGLLLVIAANRIRSAEEHYFAGKRDVSRCSPASRLDEEQAGGADDAYLQAVVNEAIAGLPPAYRQVAELRMAGHEVEEIAGIIGRSLRTTERLLQGCRANLESYFDGPN